MSHSILIVSRRFTISDPSCVPDRFQRALHFVDCRFHRQKRRYTEVYRWFKHTLQLYSNLFISLLQFALFNLFHVCDSSTEADLPSDKVLCHERYLGSAVRP